MMLSVRHLTLKLRSQSLNEESNFNNIDKSDLDRDSGTESDDELGPGDHPTTTADSTVVVDYTTMEQDMDSHSTGSQRRWIGRERTRSESGKENSTRPVTRQRRSERTSLRERCTEAVMATTLAAVAALSAGDDTEALLDRQSTDSPIEFCVTDSALPSDSDHGPWGDQHSSEEELECINGPEQSMGHDLLTTPSASSGTALRFGPSAFGPPRFCPDSCQHNSGQQHHQIYHHHHHRQVKTPLQGPEKRKWGQVNARRTPNGSSDRMKSRPRSAVLLHHSSSLLDGGCEPERSISSAGLDCSASSDDEVQSFVGGGAQDSPLPLEFRTSPPEGAHRPTRSLSPPPKFFLADQDMAAPTAMLSASEPPAALSVANSNNTGSPRKRHRHAHRSHHHIQRPCLDFEKMQQMKNRSVSTWRHDGELSLFCW